MRRVLRQPLTLLVIICLAIGCAAAGSGGSILVSEQQEIELGAEVHASILEEYRLLQDTTVTTYVASVGQEIVAVSGRPDLPHRFYVLDTEVINAFAAPGGYIYVTTELMRQMESRAELAAVLGHEVGHVSGFHGVKALETQFTLGVLLDALLGSESQLGSVVEWAVGFYWSTAHSRDQELEADRLGIEYAYAAKYNPWGLVDFFEFLKGTRGPTTGLSDFLSSHPNADDRIAQAETEIGSLGVTRGQTGFITDETNGTYLPYDQIRSLLPPVVSASSDAAGG